MLKMNVSLAHLEDFVIRIIHLKGLKDQILNFKTDVKISVMFLS